MSQSLTVPDKLIEKLLELTRIVQSINDKINKHDSILDDLLYEKTNNKCPLCSSKNDDSIL